METIDTIAPIILREEVQPVAPPAPEAQPTDTEKQVTMAQSALNELIKSRISAAGKAAREEAAALKLENQRLKEITAGQAPNSDELSRITGELASERLKNQQILDASIRQSRDLLIAEQSSVHHFVDTDTLQRLTRSNLKHDPATNTFVPVDDLGVPRVKADGTPLSVSEFFAEYGNKKPWLQHSQVITGHGTRPSNAPSAPVTDIKRFFIGKQAGALANRLSPSEYKRVKAEAIRLQIIPGTN